MLGGRKYYTHPELVLAATGEIPKPAMMLKVKGKNLTTHSNISYKPTTLLIEGPIAYWHLPHQ